MKHGQTVAIGHYAKLYCGRCFSYHWVLVLRLKNYSTKAHKYRLYMDCMERNDLKAAMSEREGYFSCLKSAAKE